MSEEKPRTRLPTPPIENMTDFVVFSFVSLVLFGVMGGWIVVVILYSTNRDPAAMISSLLDITTTIIGSLVGFIAGKGAGKAEVHEQQAAAKAAAKTAKETPS